MQKANTQHNSVVLSIAGSDNTAGAGIQADIKTAAAFGVFLTNAITAVTAQGNGAVNVYPLPATQLSSQIDAVLASMNVGAIKIGMLANEENLSVVANTIARLRVPVVLDPVIHASAGGALFKSSQGREGFLAMLPNVTLLTPNLSEAAWLLDDAEATLEEQMLAQGKALLALGAQAVLMKGGHSQLRLATDYLFVGDQVLPYSSPWQQKQHTHGSGCTLATAISCGLIQGLSLPQSVAAAKSYIQGAITHAERLRLVAHNGPVHHFYQYW